MIYVRADLEELHALLDDYLFVSLRTVEMHLTNAYRNLGISSRTELETMLEKRP